MALLDAAHNATLQDLGENGNHHLNVQVDDVIEDLGMYCSDISMDDSVEVGVAATLDGVCQVPLTSVLLLFELRRDYCIVLLLLGAVGLSSWIASSQKEKNDRGQVDTSKVDHTSIQQPSISLDDNRFSVSTVSAEEPNNSDLCELESSLCGL